MSDQAELLQAYDSWREAKVNSETDFTPAAFLAEREAELNAYRVALIREHLEDVVNPTKVDSDTLILQILGLLNAYHIEPPAFIPDIKAVAPWQ